MWGGACYGCHWRGGHFSKGEEKKGEEQRRGEHRLSHLPYLCFAPKWNNSGHWGHVRQRRRHSDVSLCCPTPSSNRARSSTRYLAGAELRKPRCLNQVRTASQQDLGCGCILATLPPWASTSAGPPPHPPLIILHHLPPHRISPTPAEFGWHKGGSLSAVSG